MVPARWSGRLWPTALAVCLLWGAAWGATPPGDVTRPVLDLTFDDATNHTVYDRSPNGAHAVLYGTLHLAPGVCGSGLQLDGPREYLEIPANPGLDVTDRFTIEWWSCPDRLTGRSIRLMDKGHFKHGWDIYCAQHKNGRGVLNLRVGGFTRPDHGSRPVLELRKWSHIVYTYDSRLTSQSLKLYVNGTLSQAWNESGRVGTNRKPLVVTAQGVLDNLRLYNVALSEADVRRHYARDPKAAPEKAATIRRIWPRRLRYSPGQCAEFDIELASQGTGNTPVRCRFDVVAGLDTVYPLASGESTLTPGKPKTLTLRWTPHVEAFECEVVGELVDPTTGRRLDRKSEVFLVARNAYQAGHKSGLSVRSWDAGKMREIDRFVFDWRRNYIPLTELMSVGLDNFSKWVPDTDKWFSGQGSAAYRNSKELVVGLVKRCHKAGIAVVPYINSAISGVHGTEFARQHPEWLVYGERGHFTGGVETRLLDLLRTFYDRYPASIGDKDLMERIRKPDRGAGLQISAVNCANERAVRFSIEQVAKGVKLFGFDGLRFDGHYQVAAPSDPAAIGVAKRFDVEGKPPVSDQDEADRLSARNTRLMKKRLWREFPGFVFGYNWGHPYQRFGRRRPLDYAECARDGGMILWESINHHYLPTSPWHRWREAADAIADEVEQPARHGGTLNVGWFHWWKASDIYGRHLFAIICAARAHLSGAGSPKIPHGYYRFAARYAGLLYDRNVKRAPRIASTMDVTAKRVWWKKYVYERRLGGGGRQIIVHLVNPPAQATTDIATQQAPPVVRGLCVTVPVPKGQRPRRVYWLSPDETPSRRVIAPGTSGAGHMKVQVPELTYWGMLVIAF